MASISPYYEIFFPLHGAMIFVAHAILRAASALVPTLASDEPPKRSHECERCTQDCVRHSSATSCGVAALCHNRCMGLEFFEWEVGNVTVLHLSGDITLGEGTRKFRQLIHDTLQTGKKNILLNMSEVVYLDSSGLGELVAGYTTAVNHGGKMKLMKLTPRVQDLVLLTKVYRIFEVFNDEESAMASFVL